MSDSRGSTAVRPRSKVRLTIEGLFWLLAALVLLSQGWLRSVNLVALIACVLLSLWVMNLLRVLLRFRLKRVRAERRIDEPVFARKPFAVTLTLSNPAERSRNQPGLKLVDRGSHHQQGGFVPMLRRGQEQHIQYTVTLPRRGKYPWPNLVVSTGYPFGLARRQLTYPTNQETIVLPTLGRLDRGKLRRLLLSQPQPSMTNRRPVRRHPVAQTEFFGLREFRSGDSPRWIHWRTSARMGELMVREFEEPPLDNLIIILDPWLPRPPDELRERWKQVVYENREIMRQLLGSGPLPPVEKRRAKEASLARREEPFRRPLELLERAVSFAATVCWEWCKQPGARLGLVIAGERPSVQIGETGMSRVWPFLENLALVPGGPRDDTDRVSELLERAPLPAGPALLVSARPSRLNELLTNYLRRPVLALDVSQSVVADLFEEHQEEGGNVQSKSPEQKVAAGFSPRRSAT
jgi:hypothetical protein